MSVFSVTGDARVCRTTVSNPNRPHLCFFCWEHPQHPHPVPTFTAVVYVVVQKRVQHSALPRGLLRPTARSTNRKSCGLLQLRNYCCISRVAVSASSSCTSHSHSRKVMLAVCAGSPLCLRGASFVNRCFSRSLQWRSARAPRTSSP